MSYPPLRSPKILVEERLRVLVEDAVRVLLRDAAGEQVFIERGGLGGRIQAFGQHGAVEVRAEGEILPRAQLEEVHGVAVEIVKALYVAVVAQELHKVVQTD